MGAPEFSPSEVRLIRRQAFRGQLDVRGWADLHECSLETVRRIARRETYRHVEDFSEAAPSDEPLPEEVGAALDALAATAARLPPQTSEVSTLLDEMQAKGKLP